jgi:hypothetical protein
MTPFRDRVAELTVRIRDKLNLMTPRLLPQGGTDGQVLIKKSDADFDTEWTQIGAWPPIITLGTGAEQIIQLPEVCNTGDVLVFVKGIFQHSGYTVVDDTLVTTQPPGFEIMVIRYGAGVRGEAGVDGGATVETVLGLNTALDAKSNVGHSHIIADIIGLQEELNELADMIMATRDDNNHVYTTPSASDTWNIVHNLGRFPSVTCVDSAGTQFFGTVRYIDENSLEVTFSYPTDGKAYLT